MSELRSNQAEVRQRRLRAAEMRAQGMTYRAIANELGVAEPTAWKYVEQAYTDSIREPMEIVRSQEIERLDKLYRKAMEVLDAEHIVVQNGRVVTRWKLDAEGRPIQMVDDGGLPVYNRDGSPVFESEPIRDLAPILEAIKTALRVSERRAKLLGLDAPQRIEYLELNSIEQYIAQLEAELKPKNIPGKIERTDNDHE